MLEGAYSFEVDVTEHKPRKSHFANPRTGNPWLDRFHGYLSLFAAATDENAYDPWSFGVSDTDLRHYSYDQRTINGRHFVAITVPLAVAKEWWLELTENPWPGMTPPKELPAIFK